MWTVDLSKFSKFGDLDKEEFKFSPKDLDDLRKMPPSFYKPFGRKQELSWDVKKVVCLASPFIVAVSCRFAFRPLYCSGIIVDWEGSPTIITSAYVLGEHAGDKTFPFPVNIYLRGGKTLIGSVRFVDQHFNIAIIEADLDGCGVASVSVKPIQLGQSVIAVGRFCSSYEIVACVGIIKIRNDDLESNDLMSSSCIISECGIGGPLLDSSGAFIGMNFYSSRSTPFLPSSVLLACLKHFKSYGKVLRPVLGFGVRCFDEGTLIVKRVRPGSPADLAGIHVDDVITHCNGFPIGSQTELGDVLFGVAESYMALKEEGSKRYRKRPPKLHRFRIKVTIQSRETGKVEVKTITFERLTPRSAEINRWPVRAM